MFGHRYPVLRRVIVTTKARESYRGLLWQRHADLLILKDAELLRERSEPLKIDGEVMIYVSHIEFVQIPPGVPEP